MKQADRGPGSPGHIRHQRDHRFRMGRLIERQQDSLCQDFLLSPGVNCLERSLTPGRFTGYGGGFAAR